jgi:ABC-type phosphate/phosphonate transport system substrate-binding protein
MKRIAAVPMYPAAGTTPTEAFWAALAAKLRDAGVSDVPDRLVQDQPARETWADPRLLFGQCCGWPLLTEFGDALRVVAAPLYVAPGCAGATHRAFLIVHRDGPQRRLADLRGSRFGINSRDSNTGMNLPRHAIAPLAEAQRFFAAVLELGSHAAALAAVAERRVDAAAIDCVSHAHLARHRPDLVAATRIIGETAPSPTLPFVTSATTDAATRDALAAALAAVAASGEFRRTLFLDGVAPLGVTDYRILLDYAEEARRLGYPELR